MTDPNPVETPGRPPAGKVDADFALRCGDVEIDRRTRRLRRDGQALSLGSRAFDLLLALIDGRAQVQGAEALRAAVWPDRTVGDNNLRVQMTHLRRLLGEQTIQHRPGRGYQLMAPVHEETPPASEMQALPQEARPGNLPEAVWPALGRKELLAGLAGQLRPGDRLTLVGQGGAGKTTLALAAATRAAALFADGAWWVDLAALHDSAQLPNAVATALQRPVLRENAMERLARDLASQRMLLVLDNCEQVRGAASELSDRLLREAPGVTLLVTSRVPLRSAGEALVAVPPLSLPADAGLAGANDWETARASGAVAVFEARAHAADPRFRVTPANAATVVAICRRLDGHALAITLAAARVPVLGLNALRDGLDERLRWTHRAAPGNGPAGPQHLSLQGALDWTYDLLNEAEQRLLRRLGVFTGRFSVAAVAAVCGGEATSPSLLRALESLVVHGLVALDSAGLLGADGTVALHTMHESARLYAHERLVAAGEADDARRALGQHLIQAFQPPSLLAPTPVQAVRGWMRLLPDAQTQVEWATTADPALALALCAAASDTWREAGQHALVRRLAGALLTQPADEASAAARIHLLLRTCIVEYEAGNHEAVLARTDEALVLLDQQPGGGDPLRRGLALAWRGDVLARREPLHVVEALYQAAVLQFRRAGNAWRERETLANLGWTLQSRGEFGRARPALEEALELSILHGDDWAQMVGHENLGELELAVGDYAAAAAHFEREIVLARRRPDLFRLAFGLTFLGLACVQMHENDRALPAIHEALRLTIRQEFSSLRVDACTVLAGSLALGGPAADPVRAHAAMWAARQWRSHLGEWNVGVFGPFDAATEARTRTALGEADRRRAQALGELLTPAEALDWAAEAMALAAPPLLR